MFIIISMYTPPTPRWKWWHNHHPTTHTHWNHGMPIDTNQFLFLFLPKTKMGCCILLAEESIKAAGRHCWPDLSPLRSSQCVLLSLCSQTANIPIPHVHTQKGKQGRDANHLLVKVGGRTVLCWLSHPEDPLSSQPVPAAHSWWEASSAAQTVAQGRKGKQKWWDPLACMPACFFSFSLTSEPGTRPQARSFIRQWGDYLIQSRNAPLRIHFDECSLSVSASPNYAIM